MSDWIPVSAAAVFPPGTHRVVEVDGAQIAVFNVNGQYYAIEDVCTHDGGILTGGPFENDEVICPRHGARFCVRTGEAMSPPAFEPVAALPVRIENGIVEVRDDRWD